MLVCGGILAKLDNNALCCECRAATVGVGENGRLIGTFASNCSAAVLRAAELDREVEDANARVAELLAVGETEEECGPPSCCLDLSGAVVRDTATGNSEARSNMGAVETAVVAQRVCTHSMAGCSTVCTSIAELAPAYTDEPGLSAPGSSAARIVLPIVAGLVAVVLLALLVNQARQDTHDQTGRADISVGVGGGDSRSLFKQAQSVRQNLGSRRLKNPLGDRGGGGSIGDLDDQSNGSGAGGGGLFNLQSSASSGGTADWPPRADSQSGSGGAFGSSSPFRFNSTDSIPFGAPMPLDRQTSYGSGLGWSSTELKRLSRPADYNNQQQHQQQQQNHAAQNFSTLRSASESGRADVISYARDSYGAQSSPQSRVERQGSATHRDSKAQNFSTLRSASEQGRADVISYARPRDSRSSRRTPARHSVSAV